MLPHVRNQERRELFPGAFAQPYAESNTNYEVNVLTDGRIERDSAIPILPARDLSETRAFYERLGFRAAGWWPRQFGGYAILTNGAIAMHFFAYPYLSIPDNYAACYWCVAEVDTLHAACTEAGLTDSGVPRLGSIEEKPWSPREFMIVDPNGNIIRVGQDRHSRSAE